MGAQTYVEARKYADLAMIEGHGYEPLPLENLGDKIHEFDIIFNTIPAVVLDEYILANVRKDALIIDLASKPGGAVFRNNKNFLILSYFYPFYLFYIVRFFLDKIFTYKMRCTFTLF